MEKTIIIDINENRHRYFFTREATQKDMKARFGVSLTTIGKYYPNRTMATPHCPPLAIQVKGSEGDVLLVEEYVRQILTSGPPTTGSSNTSTVERRFTKKVYLGFTPDPGRMSTVRSSILGPPPSATHLLYISKVAGPGATVSLRGQGSGHVEPGMTPDQLSEPMHLLLQCGNDQELQAASILAEDLLLVVRHQYESKRMIPWQYH